MTATRLPTSVTLGSLLLICATLAISCDDAETESEPTGPVRTCNYPSPAPGMCIEWPAELPTGSAQSMCEDGALPGDFSDTQTCDDFNGTDGLVGICLLTAAGNSSNIYYYGDANDCAAFEAECADDSGTWTVGPACAGGSGGAGGTGGQGGGGPGSG